MATCEWCGKNYPDELNSGEVFWYITVFEQAHIICDDCKRHLKKASKKGSLSSVKNASRD